MSQTYTKLFTSILDSTVWQKPLAVKIVWITMLAMCDKDGRVWASVPGLAIRAGVTISECEEALSSFMSPDPYSRSQKYKGRRICQIDGGWALLNHRKYRDSRQAEERREYQRIKQAEYRARRRKGPLPGEASALKAIKRGDNQTADRLAAERR